MHVDLVRVNIDEVIEAGPLAPERGLRQMLWLCVWVGIFTFSYGLFRVSPQHFWGAYYVNVLFFMGLAAGGSMITVIFQIVRATWSASIRRIAEANVAFLPWAYGLFFVTYFGKEILFPWARAPMPGREWWMQPDFVYARFAVLLALLFYVQRRYVRMSLRGDVGLVREKKDGFHGWPYDSMISDWKGSDCEVTALQQKLSFNGPVVVLTYAVIYSLFAFEMIMAMDTSWISTMFGGFMFVGNIYLGWAVLAMTLTYLASTKRDFAKIVSVNQFWDLGKLTFGFCMLWGYLFFSQFLPQWYGNLPEETQWMILRTRDWNMPWVRLGWVVFPMCFVIPFIVLLSRDVKKTPRYYAAICAVIFFGIWLEKYLIVMPQLSPDHIPFGFTEVGLFLGFLGAYGLSVQGFLSRYPYALISHPVLKGTTKW